MSTLLQVKDLKTYFYTDAGIVKAVDGVSYALSEGETLGLVGESGCGKSVSALSILRLIAYPPGKIVGGEIFFEGKNILKASEEEIREIRGNQIAMIFQEPMTSLNPVLTIGLQIGEALELHRNMNKKEAREEILRLLKMVGIPDPERRIDDYPHQFSGGMRQRVMIAMALSCNPKLLIADEPTTAVDVTIQAQLLEVVKELTSRLGTAVILITHNLGVVARHVNRMAVMYAGRIVEQGPAAEVYAHPQHPYTIGLLASVPRLDQPRKERLVPIDGQPPNLISLPPGCSFVPRCSYRMEICSKERPELRSVADRHFTACWANIGES
ncbi:MAG: ABC transporter ATP-binding protein [Deltaproteobacteria bacterium]|nr:ABC transporter ATP-binding protein [Deltaproteobacteria bacterium]